jgi:hypothetical protein
MHYIPKVGDVVFIMDPGGGHACIILTEPNTDGCVVIVNFTKTEHCPDKTTVFTHSDSALFDFPTAANYRYASIISVRTLNIAVKRTDVMMPRRGNHPNLLARTINGALASQFTSGEIKAELRSQYPAGY